MHFVVVIFGFSSLLVIDPRVQSAKFQNLCRRQQEVMCILI